MKQTFLPWSGRVDSQETGISTAGISMCNRLVNKATAVVR